MLLSLMLIDAADPRYGGVPDPDEERRRRWDGIDRRVMLPFVGSISCLIAGSVTDPAVAVGFNVAAIGLCFTGARAAMSQRPRPDDAGGSDGAD